MADRDYYCSCGEFRRSKAGTFAVAGEIRCKKCGKPVDGELVARPGTHESSLTVESPTLPPEMISTMPDIPGYRVTATRGVITELASASGFTAQSKGSAALDRAMSALGRSAKALGANAIVGFSASPFGAAGGITSAFGGDAVGVLLVGTAVVVAPITDDVA